MILKSALLSASFLRVEHFLVWKKDGATLNASPAKALPFPAAQMSNLSDHFKSGQRLSLQNRPTEVAVQD